MKEIKGIKNEMQETKSNLKNGESQLNENTKLAKTIYSLTFARG